MVPACSGDSQERIAQRHIIPHFGQPGKCACRSCMQDFGLSIILVPYWRCQEYFSQKAIHKSRWTLYSTPYEEFWAGREFRNCALWLTGSCRPLRTWNNFLETLGRFERMFRTLQVSIAWEEKHTESAWQDKWCLRCHNFPAQGSYFVIGSGCATTVLHLVSCKLLLQSTLSKPPSRPPSRG